MGNLKRSRNGVYRDGAIYVSSRMCSTCIFRPGNLMHLHDGRVDSMVAETTANSSCIPCHQTLSGKQAVCRGFFDKHATTPLQIANRLGIIKYQEPTDK